MKIAIFGGSFDPPHLGHEAIIDEALKELDIDKLIVVPTYLNPFKNKSFLDADKRFLLLKKIFMDNKKVEISNFEIQQNRSVYTIETVKHFIKKYNASKIYLIIGKDNFDNFHLWKDYKELLKLVNIVVATRSGYLNENYDNIKTLNVNINISSTSLRNELNLNYIPKKIKEDVKKIWQKK